MKIGARWLLFGLVLLEAASPAGAQSGTVQSGTGQLPPGQVLSGQVLPGQVLPGQVLTGPSKTAQSTREMAERLEAIYRANDWKGDPNKPAERAEYYRGMLKSHKLSATESMQVLLQMAKELLQAGESEKAIQAIDTLREISRVKAIPLPEEFDTKVRGVAAISYLRLGEQENCAHMHGQRSCLFPIKGSGVHALPRGAEGAVGELTAMLERNPEDWESQWLLNVAYMQLGRYPTEVPKRWLVDESLFRSERDLGEFDDVAMQAGLAVLGHAGGVVMEDFDGDGLLDIAVTSSGAARPDASLPQQRRWHFFRSDGAGGSDRRDRRLEPDCHRLRQRRPYRPAGAARWMVGKVWRVPDVAAAQPWRWDV